MGLLSIKQQVTGEKDVIESYAMEWNNKAS